jgi:guanosine-3',5'-bis(diphosphate) 3'-pyrophosphohydrolase
LEFVVTSKARTAIRHQLKQLEHEDAVQLGHRMLDRALEALGTSLDRLAPKLLEGYLHDHRYPRLESLLSDIALGTRMPSQVARVLARHDQDTPDLLDAALRRPDEKILITGHERGVITFANCCLPIPGDDIMGFHFQKSMHRHIYIDIHSLWMEQPFNQSTERRREQQNLAMTKGRAPCLQDGV